MEFRIEWTGPAPAFARLADAILGADPAALVDAHPAGAALRVATVLDEADLLRLFGEAGSLIAPEQVRRLPSVCCGGCGG